MTDQGPMPDYIEQGSDQELVAPGQLLGTRYFIFLVKADKTKLQNTVDRLFNNPAQGAVKFEPFSDYMVVIFTHVNKLASAQPSQGWAAYADIAMWLPVIDKSHFIPTFKMYPLYVIVDNGSTMATGREIYGFPKQMGWAIQPQNTDYIGDFAIDVLGYKKDSPTKQMLRNRLWEVVRETGNDEPHKFQPLKDIKELITEMENVVKNTDENLLDELAVGFELLKNKGAVSALGLVEFRDIKYITKAVYQAIVQAPLYMQKLKNVNLMLDQYSFILHDLASHPVAADTGLQIGKQPVQFAFELYGDFGIGAGETLTEIRAPRIPKPVNPDRTKVAVLGSGMGAISAIYELTQLPENRDKYDITVYQMGWRIGGKGASGRNEQNGGRVEEHGLHLWYGFYDNSFKIMKDAYKQMRRSPNAPLSTFEGAFKGQDYVVLMDEYPAGSGNVYPWKFDFPTNSGIPGEGGEVESLRTLIWLGQKWLELAFQSVLDTFLDPCTTDADGKHTQKKESMWDKIKNFVSSERTQIHDAEAIEAKEILSIVGDVLGKIAHPEHMSLEDIESDILKLMQTTHTDLTTLSNLAGDDIEEAVEDAEELIKNAVADIGSFVDDVEKLVENLTDMIDDPSEILSVISDVRNAIADLDNLDQVATTDVSNLWDEIKKLVKDFLDRIHKMITDLIDDLEDILALLLRQFRTWVWDTFGCHADKGPVREFLILSDTGMTWAIGMLEDKIATKGLFSIDDQDLRDWMRAKGANEMSVMGPIVTELYANIFGFEAGDESKGNCAAGTTLMGAIRIALTYKGHVLYKMQAAMGDTVFTPFYEVLKQRGVKFKFFQYVQNLGLGDGAVKDAIETITVMPQVDLTVGEYDPIITVKDLPSWPDQPRWEQLVDGEKLRADGVNFEQIVTVDPDRKPITLKKGEDFDIVILGIPIKANRAVTQELYDDSEAWRNMHEYVKTVQTQAYQVWFNKPFDDLGFIASGPQTPVLGSYVYPVDTFCDMQDLIAAENWSDAANVQDIGYWCGPQKDTETQAEADQDAYDNALKNLTVSMPKVLQNLVKDGNFQWDLLVDLKNQAGADRFNSQFVRANWADTERYTLSVKGSTKYRIKTNKTKYQNLFLVGDWIDNNFNAGCIEACTMSGMQASNAICGYPKLEDIVGNNSRWVVGPGDSDNNSG